MVFIRPASASARRRFEPERHRNAADEGEAGMLDEHPYAKLQVERQAAEPGGTAALAESLATLLHAAEGCECAPSRFVVVEPLLAHEPLRLHLDVEADLVVDPGLGGAWDEEAQARACGVEPLHGLLRE
jgi:hypothetical protein